VSYQRAIEEVYWRHRIWPRDRGERPDPKPSLDGVMSQAQLEKKVADYLHNSQALEDYWQRPITAEQLQSEMDRMAKHTKQPEVLHELFEALGNDPFVIAECLARPVLAERLLADSLANQVKQTRQTYNQIGAATVSYRLPTISDPADGCTDDTWTATSGINAPLARIEHTAIWTGSEMIVWGGIDDSLNYLNTLPAFCIRQPCCPGMVLVAGGLDNTFNATASAELYDPVSGSWTATGSPNTARYEHTATLLANGKVLVAGGSDSSGNASTSADLYDPATGTWTATGSLNTERTEHTATLLPNWMVLVAAGAGSSQSASTSAELYDPISGPGRSQVTLTRRVTGLTIISGRDTLQKLVSIRVHS
jgi:Galactose oxidase, central domain